MQASDYILKTSREYSLYVAMSRAIPYVTDGLKDSQRKALWVLKNKNDKIKVISLAGEMISSNIYLSGDASAAQAISYMAAPFLNNVPLIQGIGSFGTRVAPYSIGASRYVYVKKNKTTEDLMFHDMNLIPLKENYDGSVMEPITFLPIIPTILLNGVSGIAVGWSTEILPRKLEDIKEAVKSAILGKKIKELVPTYSYLDCAVKKLEEDNAWEFSGKLQKIDTSTVKITELPPELHLESFKEKLDKLEEAGKIGSYEDNSTKTIDITIKFKRGTIAEYSDDELIDLLKLRSRKTERIVVIDWNYDSIKQYSNPIDLIKDFVDWRFKFYVKRYETILAQKKKDLNYVQAIIKLFENGFAKLVGDCKNRQEVLDLATSKIKPLQLSDDELNKIINIPVYRWSDEYHKKALEEEKELKADILYNEDLLANPVKIKNIFVKEVEELK